MTKSLNRPTGRGTLCLTVVSPFVTNNQSEVQAMKRNIGNVDRVLRVVAGLALIALSATGTTGLWGWIGIVPLATALLGWCPAYTLFGIKTCKAS